MIGVDLYFEYFKKDYMTEAEKEIFKLLLEELRAINWNLDRIAKVAEKSK